MRSTSRTRLSALEGLVGFDDATLHFADGSTRTVKVPRQRQKNLKLLLAALDLERYSPTPGEEMPEEPRKLTQFEPVLRLLARAESVETDKKVLQLVHNMCRTVAEEQKTGT